MSISLYDENKSQTISETDTFTKERYQQFLQYFTPHLTVLDIGCNNGRGGTEIKKNYPSTELYGIELIAERIEKIPPGIYNKVFNESITEWQAGDQKFDRIIAGEVIEHIPENEFLKMLLKCKGLLKDNGLMLLTTPNPHSLLVKLGRDTVFNDPSHVNIMSVEKFKTCVTNAGLKVIKILGSGKATRYIGSKVPLMPLYGSYLGVISK
jgi:2-polyprenyl-3-methyl-5-hydroxy-6-metoxy-1,4-benzoquinol methylase